MINVGATLSMLATVAVAVPVLPVASTKLKVKLRIALFKTDRDWLNQAIERISKETWN
jgi:hypothetical protein